MRRFVILLAAVVLSLLVGAGQSAAQWRGGYCRPCPIVYCQPCPVIYYQPCPIVYYPCPVVYYPCPPVYLGGYPQTMPPARRAAAAQTRTITSPKGRSYQATLSNEEGDFEHEAAEPLPKAVAPVDRENTFRGKARAAAKLSLASAPVQSYDSISALIETLQKDTLMENHDPRITKDRDADRVAEEKRNVTVSAFLYAMRKEADNDYHMILGDDPGSERVRYLNSEISGLPTGGPFKAQLTQVRNDFKSFFTSEVLEHAQTRYVTFNPPIPVRITGSLFWDVEHIPPETVGPTAHKPRTAWEIHPVSKIVFEP